MRCLTSLVVLCVASGCGAPRSVPESTVRATASRDGLTVELSSDEPLHVGQNVVRYRVLLDGAAVPHAELAQAPRMEMIMGSGVTAHSCPLQNPEHAPDADGLFAGLLVFTMPTSADTRWSLRLDVEVQHDQPPVTLDFGALVVADSPLRQFVTRDAQKVMVTATLAAKPTLGANTLILTAHRADDAELTSWSPVTDLTFAVTPEMPLMGHGSASNEPPTLGEDGLYRGTVNFMMAGEWVVHVEEATLGTLDFPFTVD